MSLFPTKTRLALLADVASGQVYRSLHGGDYAYGRTVNARIAELAGERWVALDDTRTWRLTDAGRAVLDGAS